MNAPRHAQPNKPRMGINENGQKVVPRTSEKPDHAPIPSNGGDGWRTRSGWNLTCDQCSIVVKKRVGRINYRTAFFIIPITNAT